jgi:hypothetical protein
MAGLQGLRVESPQDVAVQARRLSRAVIGQIYRLRGRSSRGGLDFAVTGWEKVATPDYVGELAIRTIASATVVDVIERLRRDVLVYLDDCAAMDRSATKDVAAGKALVTEAVAAILRHGG